ncbi:unnamed protein product [Candidula unifasciata]|uniref:Uncharacterized protein n=1 Tax=Candidula unifasciata TaxID=100452 RepID=A0A8S4A2H4_9EUPU|nr:unnamed protein product [Candidula unifasciata]
MFPDSAIAKKFSLSERKCSYLVSFGLAPYFTSLLEAKLFKRNFVLLFDESMNKSFQLKQMDFHVRFWDADLLNVGSCGLHKVHDACKTAMVAAGWGLEKVLKSMYRLLEDTPARHEDYFKTSQCTQAPLKFCAHRWLENSKVAQGAFDILPHFKKFCDSAAKKEITQPQTESFETVRTAVNNDMFLSSKLAFFVSFSKQLEPFLRKYQTDNPMVPFLFTDLHNLTFAVLRRFVKKEIIANLSSTSDILNFSVNDPQNHVTGHAVDIGFCGRFSN